MNQSKIKYWKSTFEANDHDIIMDKAYLTFWKNWEEKIRMYKLNNLNDWSFASLQTNFSI